MLTKAIATMFLMGTLFQAVPRLEEVVHQLGPFTITGHSYTVMTHGRRLPPATNVRLSETLASIEIRDESGAVAYQKTFSYQVDGARFDQAISADARLLPGVSLAGLLIRYKRDLASGGSEEYWQVFRLRNQKLTLFDPAVGGVELGSNGVLPRGAVAIGAIGSRGMAASRGDPIEIRVWTGHFYVVVPLKVDWQQGRVAPGQQCFQAGSPGLVETGCEMRVEISRKPMAVDFTAVRLFSEAVENMGSARHVVLKKDAKVDFIAGKAIVRMTVSDDWFQIGLADVWLKVLIDDNEDKMGWIHTADDFSAVGLPATSAP
jgi:hypothetical protein